MRFMCGHCPVVTGPSHCCPSKCGTGGGGGVGGVGGGGVVDVQREVRQSPSARDLGPRHHVSTGTTLPSNKRLSLLLTATLLPSTL